MSEAVCLVLGLGIAFLGVSLVIWTRDYVGVLVIFMAVPMIINYVAKIIAKRRSN